MVATTDFGKDIDLRDVRFVIHTYVPKNLQSYIKETLNVGKDGIPVDCILFYSYNERKQYDDLFMKNKYFQLQRRYQNYYALNRQLLYCEENMVCRRKQLLEFMGEEFDAKDCKGMCDNCQKKD